MGVYLGIDVGAVSVRTALVLGVQAARRICRAAGTGGVLRLLEQPGSGGLGAVVAPGRRTRGRPLEVVEQSLQELSQHVPLNDVSGIMLTGSGAGLVAQALGAGTCNEFQAMARAVSMLHPEVRTVFEIGGESSRYLHLQPDPADGKLGILDYGANGDCAAGTGAFLDQQAERLKYAIEQIGEVVAGAERAAQIAGRCSVFAKTDMIHAQQKGFAPAEVLRGLCRAVALNFKTAVVRGRVPEPPIAFAGGVSANSAVVAEMREVFGLGSEELFVPAEAESLPAVGAALAAAESCAAGAGGVRLQLERLSAAVRGDGQPLPRTRPLSLEKVTMLHDRVRPYQLPADGRRIDASLGLDIGSVGTKLVLIDEQGDVIHSIFTRTEGRPIEVVTRRLREMEETVGWAVRVRAVGTTGSGRELIGELVGADAVTDEITCHKTGAAFVGDRLLGRRPDTIFEIGGQDSKYISLRPEADERAAVAADAGVSADSAAGHQPASGRDRKPEGQGEIHAAQSGSSELVVVDFTMNEACAAGTGSFLEERAEELGVSIKDEFAELALRSRAPIRLGERCTVFMERDVNTCVRRGAAREDVIAGLAYSIAHNYINRVVRGRPIGECVFFQGGTAYNAAVAAAFSMITGKEIVVPPHNAVLGAIGAAMLARDKVAATGGGTRFRGYDLTRVKYKLRDFTCRGCANNCLMQEFDVAGEKTYWGDKCSDRYRKRAKTDRKPIIPDLVALRHGLLFEDAVDDPARPVTTIGIPMAMYSWDWLPLFRRFFRDCGCRVVISQETGRRTVTAGLDAVTAEPCFPIIVAHGHVAELIERNVDYVWLPSLLTTEKRSGEVDSFVCPWGQTLPFVTRQATHFRAWRERILSPIISFQQGLEDVRRTMVQTARELGVSRRIARRAFDAACAVQQRFRQAYSQAGREALETIIHSDQPGMVLVGRPYNLHDAGVSLSIARKLRDHYGVNVLPVDALPLADIDVTDIADNMYWIYGRRILAAGKLVAGHPNLHMIYITNFKCGPDSFLKSFVRPATNHKPFLALQFDGHSNDAGMMTRCEAYLDSKGILRWWRKCQSKPTQSLSPSEPSTSPRWRTPVPG